MQFVMVQSLERWVAVENHFAAVFLEKPSESAVKRESTRTSPDILPICSGNEGQLYDEGKSRNIRGLRARLRGLL